MLLSQAEVFNHAVTDEARRVMPQLVAGEFTNNCLVRLALASRYAKTSSWTPPTRQVRELSSLEEREATERGYKSRVAIVLTGERVAKASNVVIVNGQRLHVANADFIFLLRLYVGLNQTPSGWCRKGGGRTVGGLVEEEGVPLDIDNAIRRLRSALQLGLGDVDPKDLIEGDGRGHIRLSTHPDLVTVDRDRLMGHPVRRVGELLSLLPMI